MDNSTYFGASQAPGGNPSTYMGSTGGGSQREVSDGRTVMGSAMATGTPAESPTRMTTIRCFPVRPVGEGSTTIGCFPVRPVGEGSTTIRCFPVRPVDEGSRPYDSCAIRPRAPGEGCILGRQRDIGGGCVIRQQGEVVGRECVITHQRGTGGRECVITHQRGTGGGSWTPAWTPEVVVPRPWEIGNHPFGSGGLINMDGTRPLSVYMSTRPGSVYMGRPNTAPSGYPGARPSGF
uniref:Uncharacterized protein n=1 Tax=Meloidogyne enterolobii TaxID=390850 RepID=A0A6V7VJC3_MELEN|nr:unnamed protein product [Meloidogyne enterolobii]